MLTPSPIFILFLIITVGLVAIIVYIQKKLTKQVRHDDAIVQLKEIICRLDNIRQEIRAFMVRHPPASLRNKSWFELEVYQLDRLARAMEYHLQNYATASTLFMGKSISTADAVKQARHGTVKFFIDEFDLDLRDDDIDVSLFLQGSEEKSPCSTH